MDFRKSVADTAKLILINVKLYELEKDKEVSRHRISRDTLKRISQRKAIQERFVKLLIDELSELGWTLIKVDNDYALIESEKLTSWIKLSSKRLREEEILNLESNELSQVFEEYYPNVWMDSED
ncbi:hypothetical protein [Acinetobacter sp. WCHAc060042]|uniref:hypothetical protein n=1 Tax=Acinetobacter sp. WCHAc060042 TaxID=2213016 RepID=UPI000DA66DD7|nr:hypothetical protein [Acinetobacter sp. WCHAc060042]